MSDLQNKMDATDEDEIEKDGKDRLLKDTMRKSKALEEQVQYLERRLEACRQENALKVSSAESHFGSENAKLKARQKDLRHKLQREKEAAERHQEAVRVLTADLKRARDDLGRQAACRDGWVKYVRLPDKGDWPAIQLDSQQNKKALRHIFEQVEQEGGPPVNLDPTLFLHCVVLFLWWKREATALMLGERAPPTGGQESGSEMEEVQGLNEALQQRTKVLEETLEDCRMERQTFEGTMSTNMNQLLADKYGLMNKVSRLEDTVSALHLDNNLLRSELDNQSSSQQAKLQLQALTDDLQGRLKRSETDLGEVQLLKGKAEMELSGASQRLRSLEQDASIKEALCREHAERLSSVDRRRSELERATVELQARVTSLRRDLEQTEESRSVLRKERDSFLGQLTKALEQLEDAKDRVREQNYQIKQRSDEYTQCTKSLKHQDEVIRSLQRELTNQREAQGKLAEERERRRSLEASSANQERLVRQMEERMRTEEIDSATLLAELCGAQSEERSRLEARLAAAESERDEMEAAIEALADDKKALQAEKSRLRQSLDRVSANLRTVIKRRALQALRPVGATSASPERPGVQTEAHKASSPTGLLDGRSLPKSGDHASNVRIGDLGELIDLLAAIGGATSSGSQLTPGQEVEEEEEEVVEEVEVEVADDGWEELAEAEILKGAEEDDEGDGDDPSSNFPSGRLTGDQRTVIAKLRALTLMMRARQRLRGGGSTRGDAPRARDYYDSNTESYNAQQDGEETTDARLGKSESDSHTLVDEPFITKQERQPLFSSAPPPAFRIEMVECDQDRTGVGEPGQGPWDAQGERQGRPSPTKSGTDPSSGDELEDVEDGGNLSQTESGGVDLLSSLERRREGLRQELSQIMARESRVEEELAREQEAHRLALRRIGEHQEECARMQLEKEALLAEPRPRAATSSEAWSSSSWTAGGSDEASSGELRRAFLEELEKLGQAVDRIPATGLNGRRSQPPVLADGLMMMTGHHQTAAPNLETTTPRLSQSFGAGLSARNALSMTFPPASGRGERLKSDVRDLKTVVLPPRNCQQSNHRLASVPVLSLQDVSSAPSVEDGMRSDPEENEAGPMSSVFHGNGDAGVLVHQMRSLSARSHRKTSNRYGQDGRTRWSLDGRLSKGGKDLLMMPDPSPTSPRSLPVVDAFVTDGPSSDEDPSVAEPSQSVSLESGPALLFNDEPGHQPEEDQGRENPISWDPSRTNWTGRAHGKETGTKDPQIRDRESDNLLTYNKQSAKGSGASSESGEIRLTGHQHVLGGAKHNGNTDGARGVPDTSKNPNRSKIGHTRQGNEKAASESHAAKGTKEPPLSKRQGLDDEQIQKDGGSATTSSRRVARESRSLTIVKDDEDNERVQLHARVKLLQTSLDQTAEQVWALQTDKDYLMDCLAASQEENEGLHKDRAEIRGQSQELGRELASTQERVEILAEDGRVLKGRLASEVDRNAKLQSQIARLGQDGPGIRTGGTVDAGQDRGKAEIHRPQSKSNAARPKTLSSEFRAVLMSTLKQENSDLRCQLIEARGAEAELQREADELRERMKSLQRSLMKERATELIKKKSKAAAEADRAGGEDLEAAQTKARMLRRTVQLLESANQRLRDKEAASMEKRIELQGEIESLRRARHGSSSSSSRGQQLRNDLETLTRRGGKSDVMTEAFLREQLEALIDKSVDLESDLTESRASVKELERERNVLQDDFTGALQERFQLRERLATETDRCQALAKSLADTQEQVRSLGRELEDKAGGEDAVAQRLRASLREVRAEHGQELADLRVRAEHFEAVCRIRAQSQTLDRATIASLESEVERLLATPERRTSAGHVGTTTTLGQVLSKPVAQPLLGGLDEHHANHISRLRENTEGALRQAVDKIREISEEGRQNITSLTNKGMRLCLKEKYLTQGKRVGETRKLLDRSVAEQRKQAASIAALQETMEKASLQYGALKIRLQQQDDRMSGALASWDRERQSLERQLVELKERKTLTKFNESQQNIRYGPAVSTESNESLSKCGPYKRDHSTASVEETRRPQHKTDDSKRQLQDVSFILPDFEEYRSADKIAVRSLAEDNQRLRATVYKLRERIAADQISHRKDTRMEAIYQALARAQVRVVATSMADGLPRSLLTGPLGAAVASGAARWRAPPGPAASRLAGRRHMGSVGSSLDNSYD